MSIGDTTRTEQSSQQQKRKKERKKILLIDHFRVNVQPCIPQHHFSLQSWPTHERYEKRLRQNTTQARVVIVKPPETALSVKEPDSFPCFPDFPGSHRGAAVRLSVVDHVVGGELRLSPEHFHHVLEVALEELPKSRAVSKATVTQSLPVGQSK